MVKKVPPKNSRQIHKQPQKSTRKRFVPISGKLKIVIMVGIVVCVVAVLADFFATTCFAPDKVAQAQLEQIAKDYYENYFYDKFIASIPEGKTLEGTMADFEKDGFAPVLLRHLLLYDNERNKSAERFFETTSYVCDKNETKVKFVPVSPFGKKDYQVFYTLSCNFK